mmetsp:Transcript_21833/g.47540  ORF Transcript_21833/g.47540 Transcript_21833/m.47540 type:complete len:315 (-) Transcript_21833:208-1152(-)
MHSSSLRWSSIGIFSMALMSAPTDVSAFGIMTTDRRSAIRELLTTTTSSTAAALIICTTNKQPALAVAPFAPIDALLPATRVKITIDRAVDIASNLVTEENTNESTRIEMLHNLERLLSTPQNYNRDTTPLSIPQKPAQSYLDAYAQYRNRVTILEKPGAMLVQNGEINAWRDLKKDEKAREEKDEIRAALNYYTSNLNFDPDRFSLTGTKEEKSKLIRADSVPDVRSVIASDMGLRYLLRNDVLTACDDARAELKYLLKLQEGVGSKETDEEALDGKELLELLLGAQKALGQWFDLIEEKDVLAAMDIVKREM